MFSELAKFTHTNPLASLVTSGCPHPYYNIATCVPCRTVYTVYIYKYTQKINKTIILFYYILFHVSGFMCFVIYFADICQTTKITLCCLSAGRNMWEPD